MHLYQFSIKILHNLALEMKSPQKHTQESVIMIWHIWNPTEILNDTMICFDYSFAWLSNLQKNKINTVILCIIMKWYADCKWYYDWWINVYAQGLAQLGMGIKFQKKNMELLSVLYNTV